MPPMPMLHEEAANVPLSAADLLDWHPHIQREPDAR
jgi:hypothetical protein